MILIARDNPRSSYWRKKADQYWSQVIRQQGYCTYCGRRGDDLEAHHLIRRNHLATRHKIECGLCLCRHHHRFCSQISPHLVPKAFEAWLKEAFPERYQWVQDHKHKLMLEKADYRQAYDTLKESVSIDL